MADRNRPSRAAQGSRPVGLVLLAVIIAVLIAFWVITRIEGDPTDHLHERQPSPSSASPS